MSDYFMHTMHLRELYLNQKDSNTKENFRQALNQLPNQIDYKTLFKTLGLKIYYYETTRFSFDKKALIHDALNLLTTIDIYQKSPQPLYRLAYNELGLYYDETKRIIYVSALSKQPPLVKFSIYQELSQKTYYSLIIYLEYLYYTNNNDFLLKNRK